MSKGNVDNAKNITDMMGNVKAFVGDLRTETEVAEAFFSASNGNMDMLNNMLGTQYKTFEEAKKGIEKNQGGLVDEMSKTLGGKLSTIVGKTKNSLKGVTKVFSEALVNSMSGIENLIDSIAPKMVTMAESVKAGFQAFAQSEQASQYMQIFKTVGEVVFNAIKAVIDAVKPTVQSIFTFIGNHSTEISAIIQALGAIWSSVWKTVGVLLKGAWGILEPILSLLLKALAKVSGAVESICSAWNKMVNLLKKPINTAINISKKIFGGGDSGIYTIYQVYIRYLFTGVVVGGVVCARECRQCNCEQCEKPLHK
jgi:phage-related protein